MLAAAGQSAFALERIVRHCVGPAVCDALLTGCQAQCASLSTCPHEAARPEAHCQPARPQQTRPVNTRAAEVTLDPPRIQWVFLGPPGVGKGTYSTRVAVALGVAHIAAGDLVRWEMKSGSRLGKQVRAPPSFTMPMSFDCTFASSHGKQAGYSASVSCDTCQSAGSIPHLHQAALCNPMQYVSLLHSTHNITTCAHNAPGS